MNIPAVVEIPQCGLYAKTPSALQALLSHLRATGYDIKDCAADDRRPTRQKQEQEGWYLWFASLRDDVLERKAKCGSCGGLISCRGVKSHKHRCELCGAYTYVKYVRGGRIRFTFADDEYRVGQDLEFTIYDHADMELLLYPTPVDTGRWLACPVAKQWEILNHNRAKWHWAYVHRLWLIAIPHDPHSPYVNGINTCDVHGSRCNHSIVKVYGGKIYQEFFDPIPVLDSYSIYEAWHWAPLPPAPDLHEKIIHAAGMVADCGYYYQDGRPAFHDIHLQRMRLFVEHFTTIPLPAWDAFIRHAPRSGPGMIKALAAFSHPLSRVEDKPNIGNWLVAAGNIIEGKPNTDEEEVAALAAYFDPVEGRRIRDFTTGVENACSR